MKFDNLVNPFTDEQKEESFYILQEYIQRNIQENTPFFIGRLSGNEPNLCGKLIKKQPIPYYLKHEMLTTAGIRFNKDSEYIDYLKLYTESCMNCSIMCIWSQSMYTQAKDYYTFLEQVNPNKQRICAQALEPYYFMDKDKYRYDELFKDKKVLIISSHSKTIQQQIDKNKKLFEKNIFDESTEFYVYKPVQQNCNVNDENSWKYHFEKMKYDLINIKKDFDYDIALLSCGGFGMILSNFIYKEQHTSVMYIGGPLQLYFGIFGNRWRGNSKILKIINNNWVNVLDEDKPKTLLENKNNRVCENNCYW